ncbi:MAG: four helix bundle protein [Deltaproteobacteria bacterium]|nr:four helix bundle protein [Deltaproteobacteria bacterium]
MMGIDNFKDLNIWKKGMELCGTTYTLTASFPKEELYGLTAQMRRACLSVPSNIAEGFCRKSGGDLKRFLLIARGSLAELETQMLFSIQQSYLTKEKAANFLEAIEKLGRMINSFYQTVR